MDLSGNIIFKTSKEHASNLRASILTLKSCERFCDVTIKCGDSQFKAHKMILASATKYFEAMFSNDTRESKTGVVEFPTTDPQVIKQCIDFIYTGRVGISMAIARGLLDASEMMHMPELSELCVKFLAENVDVRSCAEVMSLTRAYEKGSLEMPIRKFLNSARMIGFRKTQDFLSLDYNILVYCLGLFDEGQNHLEKEKWFGILSWTKADLARRRYFEQLFSMLDLHCLAQEFVSDKVCCEELVSKSKKCLQLINENVFTRQSNADRETDWQFESPHIVTVNEETHVVYRYDIDTEECLRLGKLCDMDLVDAVCYKQLYSITEHDGFIYIGTGSKLCSLNDSKWTLIYPDADRWPDNPCFNAVVGCKRWVVMVSTNRTIVFDTSIDEVMVVNSAFNSGFFVSAGNSLPHDHDSHLYDATVYVMGGDTVDSNRDVRKLDLYHRLGSHEEFHSFPSLNMGRHLGAGLWYRDTIYAVGGGPQNVEYFNSLVTEQWQVIRDLEINCFDGTVCLGDNTLYILGSKSHDGNATIKKLNLKLLNVSEKDEQPIWRHLGESKLFGISSRKRRRITEQ